jgi:hypothetical protein
LLILRGLSGAVATVFFFCNLYAVRHSVVSSFCRGASRISRSVRRCRAAYLLFAVIAMALLFGILLAFPQDDWTSLALVRSGQPFRESDPYFEYDLGFWTYWLPFETSLHVWSLISLLAATTVVVFLYALTPSLRWERGTLHVSGYVASPPLLVRRAAHLPARLELPARTASDCSHGTGRRAFTSADWKVGVPANFVLRFVTGRGTCSWGGPRWTGQMRDAFRRGHDRARTLAWARQLLPPLAQRLRGPSTRSSRVGIPGHAGGVHAARVCGRSRRAVTLRYRACAAVAARVVQSLSEWDAGRDQARRRTQAPGDRQRRDRMGASDSSRSSRLLAQRPTGADAVGPVHAMDGPRLA